MYQCNSMKSRDYHVEWMGTSSFLVSSFWQGSVLGASCLWSVFLLVNMRWCKSISFSWVLKPHPRSSWPCLLRREKGKEGPYHIEVGRQGSWEDFQSLPRGKINPTYFSHAAWLFIIYSRIMFPFTGVTPGNNLLNFPGKRFPPSPAFFFLCFLFSLSAPEQSYCFRSWSVIWGLLDSELDPVFHYVGKRLACIITF